MRFSFKQRFEVWLENLCTRWVVGVVLQLHNILQSIYFSSECQERLVGFYVKARDRCGSEGSKTYTKSSVLYPIQTLQMKITS
jgi:hypothetical protein